MKANMKKILLLAMLLVAALLLSGCYVEQDDTTTGGNNIGTGNNALPFSTIGVTPTPTVTPTPAPTSTAGGSNLSNVDWENNGAWGEMATSTNSISGNGTIVTMPPSLNQGGSSTNQSGTPTATPARTASVTPSTESTSSSLKAGSQGSDVSDVQQRLKELKYYTGSVDGKFGSGTTSAVKAFQEANGIKVDGIVGEKTKEKLFSYTAVANSGTSSSSSSTKTTPKPTVKATATPRPTATPNTNKYLQLDSSGADVKKLQNRLIELGYLAGKADGDYGAATEAAVKAFQKASGLWEDGKAGPDTLTKIYSSSAKKASGAASYVGDTLESGAEGDAVRALQNRLIKLKYMSGYSDGSYGEKTKSAVEAFQQNNGLTVDGKAGKTTLAKLYSDDAVDAKGNGGSSSTSGSSSSSSTGYTTLQDGDKGDDVKKLQQRLKELGYYSGSVDGSFGSGTLSAVRAFQSAMQLTVDGKAGPATQRALYGTAAKAEDTSKTLELGSEGSAVNKLQYALYELGYYQDKINGVYTQNTANAVREFQINNKLSPVDGKAGSATLSLLYSSLAKPAAAESSSYSTLKIGSKGESVVQVQSALKSLGYTSREATGEYDQETFDAVKAFQSRNGLTVDGEAGSVTQEKLFSSSAVRAN